MSPADLPEYLRADYEALPERRREAYLTAMVEAIAIAEGRAARVPTDPARRRVMAEAMAPIPAEPAYEPSPEDRAAAAALFADRQAEADAIAVHLATGKFPGPMPPSSARSRRPMQPITDRDMARSGAVG